MEGHSVVSDETKTGDSVVKPVDSATETVDSVMKTADLESAAEQPQAAGPSQAADEPMVVDDSPMVKLTCFHNKNKYTVSMKLSSTISMLKLKLAVLIGIPASLQKIILKGLPKDHETLQSLNVSSSTKIMVVANKLMDIVSAASIPRKDEVRHRNQVPGLDDLAKIHFFLFERRRLCSPGLTFCLFQ